MKLLLVIAAAALALSACERKGGPHGPPKQAEPAPAPAAAELTAAPSDASQTAAPPSDMGEEGGPHGPPPPDPLPKN